MLPQRTRTAVVPSRNALRILRQLALAGSTLGGVCTVAAITYDAHRRASVAEKIVKNKRTIQTSTPYYNATSAAKKLALMVEAAEAGEFDGLASLKQGGWNRSSHSHEHNRVSDPVSDSVGVAAEAVKGPATTRQSSNYPNPFTHSDLEAAANDLERATITRSWLTNRSEAIKFSAYDQETVVPSIHDQPTTNATESQQDESALPDAEEYRQAIRTVRDLFEKGRIIEAAELLLEKRSQTKERFSPRDRELAVNLFYANCADDNIWVARNVFEHIEEFSSVSPRMWKTLIIALTKCNAIESASQLILKYSDTIQIPFYMAELVIRNVAFDTDFSLCGVFLNNLWKKSRSIDLVNREFERILTTLARFNLKPTAKLFNPMLRAYVEFGRLKDAEILANDMKTLYGVSPTCRTKGLLLLGQAFACNWKEVKDGLREMHNLGLTSDRGFIPAFTSLFLEYWPTHNAAEIREFFMDAVEKYSLQPDQLLFEHVLQAYIQKGDPDLVSELANLANTHGWKVEIKEDQFYEHLQIHRRRMENNPVGFWQLLNAARVNYGQAAASQRILGYDHRSLPWPEANCIPYTDLWPNWYRRAVNGIMTDRPLDQYPSLDKQLADVLHAGDCDSALWFYENALAAGYVFKSYHIDLVAIAILVEKGLAPAKKLVEEHWEKDLKNKIVVIPQFFLQILESSDALPDTELIKMAVFRFYTLCWEMPKLELKHQFMNHMANRLIEQGRPEAAQDLLLTAYKSRWGRQFEFDGACMRTMLRAFVLTGHLKGIRWCLLTALARHSACNRDFIVDARRALVTGHIKKAGWVWREKERVDFLDHLGRLVSVLERKAAEDPELVTLLQNNKKRKRMAKQFYHPQIHRWRNDKLPNLRKIIAHWDEERELEWMTTQPTAILLTEDKTSKLWNERRVYELEGEVMD
ncbi:pentatricopeptide repeat protein [Talaromyces stipitatus ATCC 10500]|uniref:Pentatricopeptide repeat protein n=1 Tax=Talaromyces stipitatus (strain ATCC 10500 / CBS 375.48 / QM 6759 / NRRL 1006) TaxID=441959 RepID=B8MQ19_TALSN|nr:pentatricopeptide repeat protein [Talaromyces stipitatus ATCC 10500]EED12909.1 pentatricopeptide repeat protein [Talaromyces stipitatus ATCC 10500]